jgi:hypothetical protein
MAVRTASKSEPTLCRRAIPTNIVPLAGTPAPPQFVISPHFLNARMGQWQRRFNHSSRVHSLLFVEVVVGPGAGWKCARANYD